MKLSTETVDKMIHIADTRRRLVKEAGKAFVITLTQHESRTKDHRTKDHLGCFSLDNSQVT